MIKLSDYVFEFIASKGIDTVFTVSGGGCMHLTDSLGKNKNLKYICNHHEQASAMAAESYARVANKPGCILVTTGPGGTNTITGVLCAYQDSIPMIVISGQVPVEQLSDGTGCRQIGQQEFDIVSTVKTMTKYATVVKDPRDIVYHLQKAYHLATTGRPGPVWIDIPLNVQSSYLEVETLREYKKPVTLRYKHLINMYYTSKLQKLLNKSKRPVIVIGGGVRASNTVDELKQFLDITNIPVLTGPHSAVDVINTDYTYYAGRFGLLGQYTANHIVQESDLVISLGSRLNPKMVGYDSLKFAPKAVKFVVDTDNSEIKKLKFTSKIGWNIDLKDFFTAVNPKIKTSDISEWQQYVLDQRSKEQLVLEKHKQLTDYVSTYVFSKSLEKYLEEDSIIVTSDGTAHVVPLKTIQLKKNQRLYSNEGTAPMGYGLPAAIGAHYGSAKRVICIEGDGSIMMNLQELETIRYNQIPLTLVVINNQGYLSIKLTQNSFFNGHLVASESTSGVSIPSFEKLAKVFGFKYMAIKTNQDIDKVLKSATRETSAVLIEVFSDPNELHEPKVVAKGIDKDGRIIPGELTNMNIQLNLKK